jgi:hypothetical protein
MKQKAATLSINWLKIQVLLAVDRYQSFGRA